MNGGSTAEPVTDGVNPSSLVVPLFSVAHIVYASFTQRRDITVTRRTT